MHTTLKNLSSELITSVKLLEKISAVFWNIYMNDPIVFLDSFPHVPIKNRVPFDPRCCVSPWMTVDRIKLWSMNCRPLATWLGVCHISNSVGKVNIGWNWPFSLLQVLECKRYAFISEISTWDDPCTPIVQFCDGTRLTPTWSQLNCGGMLGAFTILIYVRYVCRNWEISWTVTWFCLGLSSSLDKAHSP